jgi:hypothetical protein
MPHAGPRPRFAAQLGLHDVEHLQGHQRLVRAVMPRAAPEEVARVDRVAQDAMDFGLGEAAVAAGVAQPHLECPLGERQQRIVAGGVQVEQLADRRRGTGSTSMRCVVRLFT